MRVGAAREHAVRWHVAPLRLGPALRWTSRLATAGVPRPGRDHPLYFESQVGPDHVGDLIRSILNNPLDTLLERRSWSWHSEDSPSLLRSVLRSSRPPLRSDGDAVTCAAAAAELS